MPSRPYKMCQCYRDFNCTKTKISITRSQQHIPFSIYRLDQLTPEKWATFCQTKYIPWHTSLFSALSTLYSQGYNSGCSHWTTNSTRTIFCRKIFLVHFLVQRWGYFTCNCISYFFHSISTSTEPTIHHDAYRLIWLISSGCILWHYCLA